MVETIRTPVRFAADPARVILKPFLTGDAKRIEKIFNRVLMLDDEAIREELEQVLTRFEHRHKHYREFLQESYDAAMGTLGRRIQLSHERKLLIGAYFTSEYSIESAAFFNPSMVPHDDQSMCEDGETHFVISFRATGEGHVSSIAFRTGFIDRDNGIRIDPVNRFVGTADVVGDKPHNKVIFGRKLREIRAENYVSEQVMRRLKGSFTLGDLEEAIGGLCDPRMASDETRRTFERMLLLARSNYEIVFDRDTHICERVIFPTSHTESHGIEDARFVRFTDDDGRSVYYGTYTATDGHVIMPQLIETPNFINYKVSTLNGDAVQNKGLALFPRRIGGMFMMVSRQDNENLFMMTSDNVLFWEKVEPLHQPVEPWEATQIGNCGSPIETPEGWILLTHGVGPMRQYCLSAILLDLEDPFRVIGRLRRPLMVPNEEEREGYVPNVLYSCGVMKHNDYLVIPYAMSDSRSGIALVRTSELLEELKG